LFQGPSLVRFAHDPWTPLNHVLKSSKGRAMLRDIRPRGKSIDADPALISVDEGYKIGNDSMNWRAEIFLWRQLDGRSCPGGL
jgi:hypothetical protein